MTPTELIAAAERIKRIRAGVEKSQDIYSVPVRSNPTRMESIEAGNKVKRLMLDDERALIGYAIESLATVRADDDEPVSLTREEVELATDMKWAWDLYQRGAMGRMIGRLLEVIGCELHA